MKKLRLLKKLTVLMRSLIIIILFLFIVSACISEEFITIKKTINDENDIIQIQEEKLNINTDRLVLNGGGFRKYLLKVEGIEKLTKLKMLLIEYNVIDLSFLSTLKNLEILIYESDEEDVNIDFLYDLSKLKIFCTKRLNIQNKIIDFKNNKQLEYVKLSNIHSNSADPYFNLEIINIPDSLRYLDLSLCPFVKKTKKLLDSIKNIPFVFLYDINDKDERYENVNENYFKENSNFIFKPAESVVPEKYREDTIYSLFEKNK